MELLYAGFDKFEVAFKGALPEEALKTLRDAREEAAQSQSQVLVSIGPGNVEMHVAEHGLKGGYAFVTDTGPTGEKWTIKDNADCRQWNLAVSVHASSLAVHRFGETRDRILRRLDAMGARIIEESVRRFDYAMDFLVPNFELDLDLVVAHGHSKVQPYYGEPTTPVPADKAAAVFRGRRVESATVGKMPGRQVIIYDKRKAAIEKHAYFWFAVWGIDRKEREKKIWRVELRAGKNELKERWRIVTFEDVENSIGDVFRHAAERVRYVADFQTDTNVSRQRLHPLWQAVITHLETSLFDFRSGLLPSQLREIEREEAKANSARLIFGNAIGYAVAADLSDEEIHATLSELVAECTQMALDNPEQPIAKKIQRARERVRFLMPDR